jgi:hypothetical protein
MRVLCERLDQDIGLATSSIFCILRGSVMDGKSRTRMAKPWTVSTGSTARFIASANSGYLATQPAISLAMLLVEITNNPAFCGDGQQR